MLSLFRTNQSYASLLLFVYALLLQLPVFFLDVPVGEGTYSYYGGLLVTGVQRSYWLSTLLPPLLVALAGIAANSICSRYRFSRTVTQFPGLGLVLLWGVCPAFHVFDPILLNHLFLLLALGALSSTYKGQSIEVARFNAGWWLGLASLLVPTYLVFIPCFIVGISIFRTADLRAMGQLLGGVVIAYFLAGTYAYLQGGLLEWYELQVGGFGLLELTVTSHYVLGGLAVLIIPLLIVLSTSDRGRLLLNIEGSKNVSFVYWMLLFAPLVVACMASIRAADAQVLVAPLGVLFGLWLVRQEAARAEFYHLILFAAALTLLSVTLVN
ncbi:hypothetical protein LEM8419_02068 [Neolewinella maritima]|uniref:Uncharacterized protein n=1 Tax=Neolewinella maritima TaxID=1383882 RepID=A0ABM9B1I0_9BACT|nr:hypothetical protein [Neolewinella maritima]CAH1001152.1 hypothetical protein LEM8419_02068 [Neolewinella maritima]